MYLTKVIIETIYSGNVGGTVFSEVFLWWATAPAGYCCLIDRVGNRLHVQTLEDLKTILCEWTDCGRKTFCEVAAMTKEMRYCLISYVLFDKMR